MSSDMYKRRKFPKLNHSKFQLRNLRETTELNIKVRNAEILHSEMECLENS
jgi:hypothetical protein